MQRIYVNVKSARQMYEEKKKPPEKLCLHLNVVQKSHRF